MTKEINFNDRLELSNKVEKKGTEYIFVQHFSVPYDLNKYLEVDPGDKVMLFRGWVYCKVDGLWRVSNINETYLKENKHDLFHPGFDVFLNWLNRESFNGKEGIRRVSLGMRCFNSKEEIEKIYKKIKSLMVPIIDDSLEVLEPWIVNGATKEDFVESLTRFKINLVINSEHIESERHDFIKKLWEKQYPDLK